MPFVYAVYRQYIQSVTERGRFVDILIHNTGETPIYAQIVSQVKGHILAGTLVPGQGLPSIRLLAKELRISVITTKRAYEELEREGFVHTVPGKGCFVAPQNMERLQEDVRRQAESHLVRAVEVAKSGNLTLEELQSTLAYLFGGD